MRCNLATIAAVVMIGLLAASCHSQPKPESYDPPGRLVDIGGRKLHLYCIGEGSPTIVLMAGGGAYSIDWALVQPKISEQTRVCSYDRAGLGWSDSGRADETVEQTVTDLHNLLRAAGEKSPYVLVGASIGGIYIRAYQHAYSDEVGGLVFSNSSNRVGMYVKGKTGLIWELTEDELRSAYPLPANAKGPAPTREDDPFDKLPAELQATRLWLDKRSWESWDPAKQGPASMLSWRAEFLREFQETDDIAQRPLGQLPVVVVSSEPATREEDRRKRDGAAARLDFLSSNTMHVTATGSGHEIHLYQPDTVEKALEQEMLAVRYKKALPRS